MFLFCYSGVKNRYLPTTPFFTLKIEGENAMKRKIMKRIVSMLLAIAMAIGCIPLSAAGVLAAPASDIPSKMLNNHMLDSVLCKSSF